MAVTVGSTSAWDKAFSPGSEPVAQVLLFPFLKTRDEDREVVEPRLHSGLQKQESHPVSNFKALLCFQILLPCAEVPGV